MILLPSPSMSVLFRGAARETLAAAYSIARIGRQDTRAWDRPDRYIVDNGEGDSALIQFRADACVGAVSCHAPSRPFNLIDEILKFQSNFRILCSRSATSPS